MKKIIMTVLVLAAIVGAIFFLEGKKAGSPSDIPADSVPAESTADTIPTSNPSPDSHGIPVVRTKDYASKSFLYPKAIELVNPDGYLNTDMITVGENIGRNVILVDFWTYSCINCQRTIPYLNDWHEKYHDKGLVIIGVHTPEFDFEKVYDNVQKAIEKFGIQYPVVQDNEYQTWRAYGNRYWPRKYLIDIDGYIVYDHIGEGNYAETEKKIQDLLNERAEAMKTGEKIDDALASPDVVGPGPVGTPEIYFGYAFARGQLGSTEGWQPEKIVDYSLPSKTEENKFYLSGSWRNVQDSMKAASDGKIVLTYTARIINIVAGSAEPAELTVSVDGIEKKVTVADNTLYMLYDGGSADTRTIEIGVPKGVSVYTFTFG